MPDDSSVSVSPGLFSTAELGISYAEDDSRTKVAVTQPLRAETGRMALRYPVGRTQDGARLYRTDSVDFAGQARELVLSLRHDRRFTESLSGVVKVARKTNAGHIRGREDHFVGMGVSLAW